MSELEQQLKQLEMNVAEQFGEVDSADDDDDDDDRQCNGDTADAVYDADNYREEEDYVLDDSLYCIACKKAFKSGETLVHVALLLPQNLLMRNAWLYTSVVLLLFT